MTNENTPFLWIAGLTGEHPPFFSDSNCFLLQVPQKARLLASCMRRTQSKAIKSGYKLPSFTKTSIISQLEKMKFVLFLSAGLSLFTTTFGQQTPEQELLDLETDIPFLRRNPPSGILTPTHATHTRPFTKTYFLQLRQAYHRIWYYQIMPKLTAKEQSSDYLARTRMQESFETVKRMYVSRIASEVQLAKSWEGGREYQTALQYFDIARQTRPNREGRLCDRVQPCADDRV